MSAGPQPSWLRVKRNSTRTCDAQTSRARKEEALVRGWGFFIFSEAHAEQPSLPPIASTGYHCCRAIRCTSGSREDACHGCRSRSEAVCTHDLVISFSTSVTGGPGVGSGSCDRPKRDGSPADALHRKMRRHDTVTAALDAGSVCHNDHASRAR